MDFGAIGLVAAVCVTQKYDSPILGTGRNLLEASSQILSQCLKTDVSECVCVSIARLSRSHQNGCSMLYFFSIEKLHEATDISI